VPPRVKIYLMRQCMLQLSAILLMVCGVVRADERVDFLDYFVQSDDVRAEWTLNGTDVRAADDPDGTNVRTFVLSKFSDPRCYEVFKVTDTDIQIRYEVNRPGDEKPRDFWIRRYQEIGQPPGSGAVWIYRFVTPGGAGIVSNFHQDRWTFDDKSRSYVIDRSGAVENFTSYISCVWADEDWHGKNQSGFRIDRVLRLISEWQREGLMVEMYDYAKGKGLVAWRWLERVSTLRPMEGDATGQLFHCENGVVRVTSKGDREHSPIVLTYSGNRKIKTRQLEVISFTSHWKPELGPQWYVIYRDSTQETGLVKKHERLEHDYALPEWGPDERIGDLPRKFTE
jgi:hypothetical protein